MPGSVAMHVSLCVCLSAVCLCVSIFGRTQALKQSTHASVTLGRGRGRGHISSAPPLAAGSPKLGRAIGSLRAAHWESSDRAHQHPIPPCLPFPPTSPHKDPRETRVLGPEETPPPPRIGFLPPGDPCPS